MRKQSHGKTWIAVTLDHVNAWRKSQAWSRESVVAEIEKAHERIGGPAKTGLRFEPKTQDVFERMKINAERVFRWLDDHSKDNNLLTLNFTESIVAAMPTDVALHYLNDLLRPLGYAAHAIAPEPAQPVGIAQLQELIKEAAEAQQAVADLLDGATLDELVKAQAELTDAVESGKRVLAAVESELMAVKA